MDEEFDEYNDQDSTDCANGDYNTFEENEIFHDNEGDEGEEYDEGGEGPYDDEDDDRIDGVGFAREGSALRAATRSNPRIHPCPTCGQPNRLTAIDVQRHYQCDDCADRAEGRMY